MTTQSHIIIVGAIIIRDGLVFAARRSPERSAGGQWEFPGGKVELGETPIDALRRGLREDLGIEVRVGGRAARYMTPVGSRLIDLTCYWAELESDGRQLSAEYDAIGWFTTSELAELSWSVSDFPVVRDVLQVLEGEDDEDR